MQMSLLCCTSCVSESLTFSSAHLYQKDELVLPGNLYNRKFLLSPLKHSFSHCSPSTFSSLFRGSMVDVMLIRA
jgi:hypothetical protein